MARPRWLASSASQLDNLFVLDHRAQAPGLAPHDGRIRDDRHLFLDASDDEIDVDARFPVAIRMPSRRTGLNPERSTSMRYSPGARLAMV